LLWHQHQPIYRNTLAREPRGSYLHPWVRLHALRDYYSMAHIVKEHDGIHLTVNLSGSLLWQLRDYLEGGATDRALELTRKPAETLTTAERQYVLTNFFDAHWHNQVAVHPRYGELFVKRRDRRRFSTEDLRDLQMWFNLAWFGKEFREGEVELATGETASVRDLVAKGRGFAARDIDGMIAEQFKILRAVIPLHRALQNEGRIEVVTTPFAHPILPLIVDTDEATIDRPAAKHPARFHHPEDADAQVEIAVRLYRDCFGASPEGMWPAEGAVSASTVPIYARNGVRWIASDEGVLARSARWGYDVRDPHVLCRPYRVSDSGESLSVFFRETRLSNAIGFDYQGYADYRKAAEDFVGEIKERYARKLSDDDEHVLTVILDGENAWGSYEDDGRPFLEALYRLLAKDSEIRTVTFREYLTGNAARGVSAHPMEQHRPVLLGRARAFLEAQGATPGSAPEAFESLYFAEGSDWFWWFGSDQDSGRDEEFDELFRTHLRNVYRARGARPPEELEAHIVPRSVLWTHVAPVHRIQPGDRLSVRTHCPGELEWSVDGGPVGRAALSPVGGVMAGASLFQLTLGPFLESATELRFRFECRQLSRHRALLRPEIPRGSDRRSLLKLPVDAGARFLVRPSATLSGSFDRRGALRSRLERLGMSPADPGHASRDRQRAGICGPRERRGDEPSGAHDDVLGGNDARGGGVWWRNSRPQRQIGSERKAGKRHPTRRRRFLPWRPLIRKSPSGRIGCTWTAAPRTTTPWRTGSGRSGRCWAKRLGDRGVPRGPGHRFHQPQSRHRPEDDVSRSRCGRKLGRPPQESSDLSRS
jgi:alpha-amylase/alpha-mannosidase (GH57 family)